MNTEPIIAKLQQLENKLYKLVEEQAKLKAALSASMSENEKLNNIIAEQNEELKNFQNQEKISKIVSSIAEGTQNNTELKLKINEYIKEIDRCIVFLNE